MSRIESPYIQQYPNPDVAEDSGKVTGALVVLWIFGVLNLLVGAVLLADPGLLGLGQLKELPPAVTLGLAIFSLAWGGTYIAMAVLMHTRKSVGAAKAALVLASIELALGVLSFNLINIGLNVLKVWLIKRGADALELIRARVDAGDQQNVMTEWYHAFVPLLVEVARADGNISSEEVASLKQQLDRMNVSDLEREMLFKRAVEHPIPLPRLVDRYRSASARAQMAWAEDRLIQALVLMAAADRVIHPAERRVLGEIASAMGYPAQSLDAKLRQAESQMKAASPQEARELFGLPADASREQIDARYRELLQQNDPAEFAHLGSDVVAQIQENRQAVEQSYRLLLQPA
jgi:uncharacterized membrane protein YebE (DUF533 family)